MPRDLIRKCPLLVMLRSYLLLVPSWTETAVTNLETVTVLGEIVNRLLGPIMVRMSKQRMVSENILTGNRLVEVPTSGGSLHLEKIILRKPDQRLLTQIRDSDEISLTRGSQVRVILDMRNLRVGLLGEDILNLQPLGDGTLNKTKITSIIILATIQQLSLYTA